MSTLAAPGRTGRRARVLAARRRRRMPSRITFTAPCSCGRLVPWTSLRDLAGPSTASRTFPACTCTGAAA